MKRWDQADEFRSHAVFDNWFRGRQQCLNTLPLDIGVDTTRSVELFKTDDSENKTKIVTNANRSHQANSETAKTNGLQKNIQQSQITSGDFSGIK